MYLKTTATNKIKILKKRLRCIQGGTSASKTVSIVLYLIAKAQSDTEPTLTSVVSESFPHLKRGVMRDFLLIMEQQGYFVADRWNKTDYIYTFETGSKIEFFSADQPGKVRGPRRDRLFINEANNIPFETFEQLEVRTKEFIFLDWNPVSEFWFYHEILDKRKDLDHIVLNYLDNEALDQSIVDSIESRKGRAGWWKVYGMGQLGEVEGKIYKDWEIIDKVPSRARLERRGLDFGYSNDPSAIVDIFYYDQGYIWDEVLFQKGMSNKRIAETILAQDYQCLVVADSAEPKSIDDIKGYGVNIIGAEKGKDSVKNGIQIVQEHKIAITKRSINIIREYRNYLWETDKDGLILNVPEHPFSHTMDAGRYAMRSIFKAPITNIKATEGLLPYYPEIGL